MKTKRCQFSPVIKKLTDKVNYSIVIFIPLVVHEFNNHTKFEHDWMHLTEKDI